MDYPGISPLHCFLKDTRRARYTAASDEQALNAYKLVTKFEKLRPSLEPSHAFAVAIAESKKLSKNTIVVVNSCGDAYNCLLYTSPSPRDVGISRMPSSA